MSGLFHGDDRGGRTNALNNCLICNAGCRGKVGCNKKMCFVELSGPSSLGDK